jgi:rhodanese-related sulfurtransferase
MIRGEITVTLLDSRLLSEYAFQRMAGAATRLPSRDLVHKDASSIERISTDQEGNSVS